MILYFKNTLIVYSSLWLSAPNSSVKLLHGTLSCCASSKDCSWTLLNCLHTQDICTSQRLLCSQFQSYIDGSPNFNLTQEFHLLRATQIQSSIKMIQYIYHDTHPSSQSSINISQTLQDTCNSTKLRMLLSIVFVDSGGKCNTLMTNESNTLTRWVAKFMRVII